MKKMKNEKCKNEKKKKKEKNEKNEKNEKKHWPFYKSNFIFYKQRTYYYDIYYLLKFKKQTI